jgi:HlyD family secretion protein
MILARPPSRQGATLTRKVILGTILLAVLVTAGFILHSWLTRQNGLVYGGTVETREIQIGSKIGGRVTAVLVDEGDAILQGAPLVHFECDDLKAQRAQALAKVQQAQANLEKMKRGYRPEEIAQARAEADEQLALFNAATNGPRSQELKQAQADYDAAQADANNAEIYFGRMEMLVRGETISRQQYDDAKAKRDTTAEQAESYRQKLALLQAGTRKEDLQAAEERYRQAAAQSQMMQSGYRKEDIAAAQAEFAEAQDQVAQLDAQLKEADLLAPANGVVEVVSVRPGDLVPAGRIVMTMLESSQLWVKVYVPETDLSSVRLNQQAQIEVDSPAGTKFTGHVEQIDSEAEFLPRNIQTRDDREHEVFGVKVRIDGPNAQIKSGMSATVHLQ